MNYVVERQDALSAEQMHQWAREWLTTDTYLTCDLTPHPSFSEFETYATMEDRCLYVAHDEAPRAFLVGRNSGSVSWFSLKPFRTPQERLELGPDPRAFEVLALCVEQLIRDTGKVTLFGETGIAEHVRPFVNAAFDQAMNKLALENFQFEVQQP